MITTQESYESIKWMFRELKENKMIHEDERRILESFPEAKIIKVKKDTEIGKHYHKIKTEKFILCEGEGKVGWMNLENGLAGEQPIKIGELIEVNPLLYHVFYLKKDSVLIGINSHPYDPTDDYKL